MIMLKRIIARTRWGNQLTEYDYSYMRGLTLWEVFKAPYLTPKSLCIKFNRSLRNK